MFGRIRDVFGRLDVLFNNAGTGAPAVPIDELPEDRWRAVVDTNINGTFFCTQQAFKLMRTQRPPGGRIINNGSVSAHAPRPMSIAYTATKHAITGLTKSVSLDGRQYGIACGQIDIGNAKTEMTARMAEGVPQADGSLRAEPRMNVDDAANAVVMMASLPLESNVLFMTVMATNMPFVGRG
jgi:NAD(P)-dependent dehydrogenase (short-subunit alcohol dehydrogenase family)